MLYCLEIRGWTMRMLLLALLLAFSPAMADSPEVQLFTARAEGSLTIGPDGRVVDVALASPGRLGEGVLEGYEERIRAWRFEPILEDGRPVTAKGQLQLSLVAAHGKGDRGASFGIRSVRFLDPPGTAVYAEGSRWVPPGYPAKALEVGVDAELVLVLKLDAQGRAAFAATEQLALRGVLVGQAKQPRLAEQFRRSAEKAVSQWVITGHPDGAVVRVPVSFSSGRWDKGWVPTAFTPIELPEWAALALTAEQATELGASGVATAPQFKLLTPLDGA